MDSVCRNHRIPGFRHRISHGVGNGFQHHHLQEDAEFNGVSRQLLNTVVHPACIHGHRFPAGWYFGHFFQHKISEIRLGHHQAPILWPERLSGGNDGPKPPMLEIRRHPHDSGIDRVHFLHWNFHLVAKEYPKKPDRNSDFRVGLDLLREQIVDPGGT